MIRFIPKGAIASFSPTNCIPSDCRSDFASAMRPGSPHLNTVTSSTGCDDERGLAGFDSSNKATRQSEHCVKPGRYSTPHFGQIILLLLPDDHI